MAVERVLLAVEQIPAGRVAAYSDVGRLAGVGPRQVGAIMREHGSEVPWWRVVNVAGELPAALVERAAPFWADEGIPLREDGRGCRIRMCRVDVRRFADAYHRRLMPE